MAETHVLQSDGLSHLLCHTHLLAYAVNQMKFHIGKQYGQRNAGKTTACAQVHHSSARTETDHLSDAQGMEHMMLVKVFDVLATDDVDLAVPVGVKGVELSELLLLLVR